MKTLEIVTHCWRFSKVMTYQLSSLVLHPPKKLNVIVTVLFLRLDGPTVRMLKHFSKQPEFILNPKHLSRGELMRRAVGRNIVAKETTADLVWFCDADNVFGEGCLDALAELKLKEGEIYYPKVFHNSNNKIIDEYVWRVENVATINRIDPCDFIPRGLPRAIGGFQIVTGDTARKYGYCAGSRILKVTGDSWIGNTRGDVIYRIMLKTNGIPIDLPNLYRIRQGTRGVVDTLE